MIAHPITSHNYLVDFFPTQHERATMRQKKKDSPTGQVSLESTEIVDNLIDDVLTEANIEIEEDKLSNVVNAVANLVSTISADQDDETTKAVLSFGVTTFLSDVVEIVEGTASDEKINSYNAQSIVETLSTTLSIDSSRLNVTTFLKVRFSFL